MDQKQSALAIKEGWLSILLNLLLFGIKFWAGAVSGSVALIADAWHSLSDSLSSLFVIIGIRLARIPADKEHPFGHGRYELITTILIGCLLAIISYNFLVEAISRLQTQQQATFGWLAIIAISISIVAKEGIAQYAFHIGRKSGSRSVIADGWHHRTDAISSVIILVGILVGSQFWWIDGGMGIAVAILIFHAAWVVIKGASSAILGEQPSSEIVERINEITTSEAGAEVWVHHIHLHNYVTHKEITFHMHLHDGMTIVEAHSISTAIEERIKHDLQMNATIHIDPQSIRKEISGKL